MSWTYGLSDLEYWTTIIEALPVGETVEVLSPSPELHDELMKLSIKVLVDVSDFTVYEKVSI